MHMEYIRFSQNYNTNKLIPINKSPYNYIINNSDPYFISMMKYSQEQYDTWKQTKTLSGMTGSTTNRIWADFDNADLKIAFDDSIVFYNRLKVLGIQDEHIQISFSGSKGVGFIIDLEESLTIDQVRAVCFALGSDRPSFDKKMYDHQRIFRLLFTKNEKTGLYKIPLTSEELLNYNLDEIKLNAKDVSIFDKEEVMSYYKKFKGNEHFTKLMTIPVKPEPTKVTSNEVLSVDNLPTRPKYLDQARWMLVNGFFKEGERSHALLCIASTYKSMGYPEEITYRLLKGVAEVQAKRNNMERFPDEEIYNNIVKQVYGSNWRGGTYSTKDPTSWLYDYCQKYKINVDEGESKPMRIHEISSGFLEYIENFENNRITFGIESLDKEFIMTGGSVIALVGSASSGKTSLMLNLLANTSRSNTLSIVASLDMSRNRLFEKILYRQMSKSREETFKTFKEKREYVEAEVAKDFSNVFFYDRSSPTVGKIREYVSDVEQTTGEKVKLLVIDYFERVSSDLSEDTAASKRISSELQDLANDFPHLCVVVLFQPNKFSLSGGPDTPILSYTTIKGSSFIYQSCRQILSLWRPGFNPQTKADDKYMQMAILKNDLGELNTFDFGWVGKTGSVYEMEESEHMALADFMRAKARKKKEQDGSWE